MTERWSLSISVTTSLSSLALFFCPSYSRFLDPCLSHSEPPHCSSPSCPPTLFQFRLASIPQPVMSRHRCLSLSGFYFYHCTQSGGLFNWHNQHHCAPPPPHTHTGSVRNWSSVPLGINHTNWHTQIIQSVLYIKHLCPSDVYFPFQFNTSYHGKHLQMVRACPSYCTRWLF